MADGIKPCEPIPCSSLDWTLNTAEGSEFDQLTSRAHRAYAEAIGREGVAFTSLPPRIREAWYAAVRQVVSDM